MVCLLVEIAMVTPFRAMAAFTVVQIVVVFIAAIIFIRFTRSKVIDIQYHWLGENTNG